MTERKWSWFQLRGAELVRELDECTAYGEENKRIAAALYEVQERIIGQLENPSEALIEAVAREYHFSCIDEPESDEDKEWNETLWQDRKEFFCAHTKSVLAITARELARALQPQEGR